MKAHGLIPLTILLLVLIMIPVSHVSARDLNDIKAGKVLRHLGVPYANFVTGSGGGMDVELVRMFAQSLGLRYEYVATNWKNVIGDLTGKTITASGDDITVTGEVPVKGDLIASGLTVLPWRMKIVHYSEPTFPTQVWVLARADLAMRPITPTGEIDKDIRRVKSGLSGVPILGVAGTCLEPSL